MSENEFCETATNLSSTYKRFVFEMCLYNENWNIMMEWMYENWKANWEFNFYQENWDKLMESYLMDDEFSIISSVYPISLNDNISASEKISLNSFILCGLFDARIIFLIIFMILKTMRLLKISAIISRKL